MSLAIREVANGTLTVEAAEQELASAQEKNSAGIEGEAEE